MAPATRDTEDSTGQTPRGITTILDQLGFMEQTFQWATTMSAHVAMMQCLYYQEFANLQMASGQPPNYPRFAPKKGMKGGWGTSLRDIRLHPAPRSARTLRYPSPNIGDTADGKRRAEVPKERRTHIDGEHTHATGPEKERRRHDFS